MITQRRAQSQEIAPGIGFDDRIVLAVEALSGPRLLRQTINPRDVDLNVQVPVDLGYDFTAGDIDLQLVKLVVAGAPGERVSNVVTIQQCPLSFQNIAHHHDVLGMSFKNRARRFEEQIEVMRRLWTERVATCLFEHNQVEQVQSWKRKREVAIRLMQR